MNVEVLENISLIRLTARIPAAYRGQQPRLQADLLFNRPSFLTNCLTNNDGLSDPLARALPATATEHHV